MTTQVVVAELETLKFSINAEAAMAEEHASRAVQHAINAGRMLVQVKEHPQIKHGEFQSWIAENISVSYSHCSRYMKVFAKYSEGVLELTEDISLSKALGDTRKSHVKVAPAQLLQTPDPRVAELEAELEQAAAKLKADLADAQRAKSIAEAQAKSAKQALAEAELAKQRAVEDALAKVPKPKVADTSGLQSELAQLRQELKAAKKQAADYDRASMNLAAELRKLKEATAPKPPPPKAVISPLEWIYNYLRKAQKETLVAVLSAIRRLEHPDKGGSTEVTAQLNIMIEELK